METHTARTQLTSFNATITGAGKTWLAQLTDEAGTAIGRADSSGQIVDASGQLLATAKTELGGRGNRGTDVRMQVTGPDGQALGAAQVVKYGVGPRSAYANLSMTGPDGTELARLERQGRDNASLAVVAGERQVATMTITKEKAGFLKKRHVHAVRMAPDAPESLRELVPAILVRYHDLLSFVRAAASD